MESILKSIEKFSKMDVVEYCEKSFEFNDELKKFVERDSKCANTDKFQNVSIIKDIAMESQPWMKIHLLSFLMQYDIDANNTNLLLQYVCGSSLGIISKFFIYYQVIRLSFLNSDYVNLESQDWQRKIYKQVYEWYKETCADEYKFLPKEERNKDLVILIISQFLSEHHGPTKTILDRCEVLKKKLNKKVLIINTAEFMTAEGSIPFYEAKYGNYYEELHDKEFVEYHGEHYAYLQCDCNMPNVNDVRQLLEVVKSYKPYCIINIGGSSIASDMCSNIVPTIAVSTVFSGLTMTEGQFQVIGRDLTQKDREVIKKWNVHENHVIESVFTFSFKEQKHIYNREDFDLPLDRFIAILVGGRLTSECTDEFLEFLTKQMKRGLFVVFVGGMEQYKRWCENSEVFKENSRFLGVQDDVLAIDELCDLYINPPRTGGGTAIVEAMYKGLPAITLDKGDSSVSAGKDFCVKDLQEMSELILRYMTDIEFYENMSNKAKEHALRMLDSSTEFVKVFEKIEKLSEFCEKQI